MLKSGFWPYDSCLAMQSRTFRHTYIRFHRTKGKLLGMMSQKHKLHKFTWNLKATFVEEVQTRFTSFLGFMFRGSITGFDETSRNQPGRDSEIYQDSTLPMQHNVLCFHILGALHNKHGTASSGRRIASPCDKQKKETVGQIPLSSKPLQMAKKLQRSNSEHPFGNT